MFLSPAWTLKLVVRQKEVPNNGAGLNCGFCLYQRRYGQMIAEQRRIFKDSMAGESQAQRGQAVFPESHSPRLVLSCAVPNCFC